MLAQEEFARSGQFAVSAERLFGVVHTSTTREDSASNTEVTNTFTSVNLLSNPFSGVFSAYSFPRLAGDYFAVDGLSLGAALGFFTASSHVESDTIDEDTGSATGFLLAPRLGYAYMFNPTVGLWPRAGISYLSFHADADSDSESDSHLIALNLEAALVVSPIPHVAFLIGPALDLGLSGSQETTTSVPGFDSTTEEIDRKATDVGLHVGLLAYF